MRAQKYKDYGMQQHGIIDERKQRQMHPNMCLSQSCTGTHTYVHMYTCTYTHTPHTHTYLPLECTDDELKSGRINTLDTLLHNMVPILVLDTSENMSIQLSHQRML